MISFWLDRQWIIYIYKLFVYSLLPHTSTNIRHCFWHQSYVPCYTETNIQPRIFKNIPPKHHTINMFVFTLYWIWSTKVLATRSSGKKGGSMPPMTSQEWTLLKLRPFHFYLDKTNFFWSDLFCHLIIKMKSDNLYWNNTSTITLKNKNTCTSVLPFTLYKYLSQLV